MKLVDTVTRMSCSFCSVPGIARCSICLSWYCSLACQGSHWPLHRRECVPPPALLLPDGSPLLRDGQENMVNMNEVVNSTLEIEKIEGCSKDKKIQEKIKNDKYNNARITNLQKSISSSDSKDQISDDHKELKTTQGLNNVPFKTDPAAVMRRPKSVDTSENNQDYKKSTSIPTFAIDSAKSVDLHNNSQDYKKSTSSLMSDTNFAATKTAVIPKGTNSTLNTKKSASSQESTRAKDVKSNQKSSSIIASTEELIKLPSKIVKPSTDQVNCNLYIEELVIESTKPVDSSQSLLTKSPPLDQKIETNAIYPPAVRSAEIPSTIPPIGPIVPICSPVLNFVSPFQFGVRLVSDESSTEKMVADMTRHPPPVKQGWKVGRSQTLAVCHEGVWFRGVAVKKTGDQYSIYLLDYGTLVTAEMEHLRPLPYSDLDICPSNIQVCLAGVGPLDGSSQWSSDVCEAVAGLLNSDPDYKLGVEFLGQVEGGRWAVKMTGLSDQQDVANMLIEGGVAVVREDLILLVNKPASPVSGPAISPVIGPAISPVIGPAISPIGETVISPIISKPVGKEEKTEPAAEMLKKNDVKPGNIQVKVVKDLNNNIKIMRGMLTEHMDAAVCHMESPDCFFLCPSSSTEQFLIILQGTQSPSPESVDVEVGDCCLAQDEGCWYRAEVVRLRGVGGGQVASLFLLDYGKTLEQSLVDLRPLEKFLDIPGLVVKVGLAGVQPGQGVWTEEEIEGAQLLLDVGGETVFSVKQIGLTGCSPPTVILTDCEGTDVTDLMLTAGIGVKCDAILNTAGICMKPDTSQTYYSLPAGLNKLVLMSAESPALFYLCSLQTLNNFQSTIQPAVDEAAGQAVPLDDMPTEGMQLLACEEGTWYRAVIKKVVDSRNVVILLLDMGCTTNVLVDKLRKVPDKLFTSLQIVAVPSVLLGWEGLDEHEVGAKWGVKMGQIVECFDEIEVEVLGKNEVGKEIVRVPEWEGKLNLGGEKKMSTADQLKLKLKKVKC